MTMDLRSLGKLAFDLHISQDSKSLSAVEDVFYLLSDRRPCLVSDVSPEINLGLGCTHITREHNNSQPFAAAAYAVRFTSQVALCEHSLCCSFPCSGSEGKDTTTIR
jgi:hypothetical protein